MRTWERPMPNSHPHTESDSNPAASGVKDAVQRQFSQVAANYSTSAVHATGAEFARMLQLARLDGTESVLDAGCGPGHTALTFAPHVAQVVAVDLSNSMLDVGRALAAQRAITNAEFRRADVERLPFASGAFDLVATRFSAHHWPNPGAALTEFQRVLRPAAGREAQLLLVDVVSYDDPVLDTHLQAIELLRDPSHVRDHTVGQWLTMLAVAGFQPAVDSEWELRIDFTSWVERMRTPAPAVTMIRTLLDQAPAEVRHALKVEPDSSFTLRCALLRATRTHTV